MPLKFWRRTRTTAASQADTAPAWSVAAHFQPGQMVISPYEPQICLRVEGTTADRVRTDNPLDALPADAGNDVLWWTPEQLRHLLGCPPCEADAARIAADEAQKSTSYWNQWDQADRDLYDAIVDSMVQHSNGSWSFGPDAPVPLWMRTCFDGHLGMRESPSLDLGRIVAPLDWWQILADHAKDGFRIVSGREAPEGTPSWDRITAAFNLLSEAGYRPALDVQLELDTEPDGTAGVTAYQDGLTVPGAIDSETYERLLPIIGNAISFPHTSLIRPYSHAEPGIDPTRTYTGHHDYDYVLWLWFDDNYVPPTAAALTSKEGTSPA